MGGCPAEAVRTPLVWLRRADASDESSRTQRDFDRDDSEPTGVQCMPQMARSTGSPNATTPLNILGYNTLTNTGQPRLT